MKTCDYRNNFRTTLPDRLILSFHMRSRLLGSNNISLGTFISKNFYASLSLLTDSISLFLMRAARCKEGCGCLNYGESLGTERHSTAVLKSVQTSENPRLHIEKSTFLKGLKFLSRDLLTASEKLSACVTPYIKVLNKGYRLAYSL